MPRVLVLLLACALALTACGSAPTRDGAHDAAHDAARGADQGDRPVRDDGAVRLAASTPPAVVTVEGDIACPPSGRTTATTCRQADTARLSRAMRPDAVIGLGDLQYDRGTLWTYQHSYAASWGLQRAITWPVPGNHEYYTPGAGGYYRYWKGRQPGAPGYYRRAINGWQVYLLNSNCDRISCAAEQAWLDRQLTEHPSTCQLIAMHHPRYSSGGEHGNSSYAVGLWKVALQHKVDVALAGHDHDYERFARKDNAGHLTSGGMQSFVVGAGGKSLYPKGTTKKGSMAFVNDRFGVLRLALRPGGWTWQYFDLGRNVLDKGWLSCH